MGILTQHMYKSPVPMRALVPEVGVPAGLDAIVLKCLTKKPDGRYQTMDELVADIEKLERGLLPDAVQELMARSGGFNVPADYFRSPSMMPAPVPASPALPKQRWPIYAVIGAIGTTLAIVIVGVARSGGDTAHAQPVTPSALPSAQPPGTPAATAAATLAVPTGAPTATAPQVAKHQVLVSVIPPDSMLVRDGADLGGAPVALELVDGASAKITVSHKGYKTKEVTIGPDEPKLTVTLEPLPTIGPKYTAAKPHPGGGGGGGGVDDVGDPFKH
jgi:serine/threonine-protein kinase